MYPQRNQCTPLKCIVGMSSGTRQDREGYGCDRNFNVSLQVLSEIYILSNVSTVMEWRKARSEGCGLTRGVS